MKHLAKAALAAFAFALSAGGAHADKFLGDTGVRVVDAVHRGPLIADVIMRAKDIAVVKLRAREAVYDALTQDLCGYVYHADVTESLKGHSRRIDFYSARPDDFPDGVEEFLIYTFPWDDGSRRDYIAQNAPKPTTCRLIDANPRPESYTPSKYQTVFPFSADAARSFGGKWLSTAAARPSYLWCLNKDSVEALPADIGETVNNHHIIEWDAVRTMIREQLAGCPSSICKKTRPRARAVAPSVK
jgi:hypothetical protein